MTERPVTAYMADSPMCEKQNELAIQMLAAGRVIAIQLRQPSDNEQSFRTSALVSGLQTLISTAVEQGLTDNDVFKALSVTLGWAATRQTLGPIGSWVVQLHDSSMTAARMCLEASPFPFEPQGRG